MSEYHTQVDNITVPEAAYLFSLAASSIVVTLDLSTVKPAATDPPAPDGETTGLVDRYIRIYADGGDVYVVFGPTKASVTGVGVPDPTVNGSVDANGIYTANGKECWPIPSGQYIEVRPTKKRSFVSFICRAGVSAQVRGASASHK